MADKKERRPQHLYTVYRRKDDSLIAFEETAPRAAELMGIKACTFYSLVSRLKADPGFRSRYDIVRTLYDADGNEVDNVDGQTVYTVYLARDDTLICHEQPAESAARAIGVTVKSLQSKISRQLKWPERRYKYRITRRRI